MNEIGNAMYQIRDEAGLTLKELSKLSGVPPTSIHAYEIGNALPGIKNLIALADALKIGIDDYIGHRIKG